MAGFLASGAQAQSATALVQAQVPAGPLGEALSRFALQAGVSLAVDADKVKGKTSAGLTAAVTVDEGFRRLLLGSGYRIDRSAAGFVLVAAPAAPAAPQTAQAATPPVRASAPGVEPTLTTVLPVVTVTSNRLGDITEGTGSYTAGAIATATRLVLTPRETPQAISVVTRQEMSDFNLTSIDAVMAHTPGVSIVTYDSERTEYYARGFAIQNFQYDGIPMQRDSSYSAGNTLTDMVIYDRVEVLKGATGLLTGSGDPGATINLIRKKPTKKFQGEVSLGAGSWDSYRSQLDVSGALNSAGSLRGRAVAAYQDNHSQLDGYERKTSTFYAVLEADLSMSTLLTLGADYQDNTPTRSTWGGIPIYDSNGNFNEMPRSFNNGANWSSWKQYTRTAFATLEHSFDNDWLLKAQFNHQINGYDAPLGAAASGYPNPADGSGVSTWEGKYVGKTVADALDVYASGPFELLGRKHELVLGGSLSERTWTNQGYWTNGTSVTDYFGWNGNLAEPDWDNLPASNKYTNREVTRESGLYATARLNLRDDLKLIAGSRVQNYKNETTDKSGVIVPYLGSIYDLNKQYSLYASYTSIYKPQSLQDVNGKTLDPLEGLNYEVGIKGSFFNSRLNASASVFMLEQDNYANPTSSLTPGGDTAYESMNGVRTKGFEMEVSGELMPQWQIHAGFSHKISRQQGEKVVTLTPENQFTLSTAYKPNVLPGLTLGGGARWQDKTWDNVSHPTLGTVKHTVSGYWLFDAMAGYQIDKNLSVNLNVSNLLDKKYYTIFSWYSTYTWGAGRAFNLNATYKF
ncbi:TonB-dependent siderophore receptor [Roseateles sp. SL47]|uniref:TonB-dependent siderophore receptor n=1 Tax=Roseateles sp. SL47 TaxID=2995138 RepID=UPI00226F3671|nr:TonB-dependent receptor [Roseateles sp. SL47]WAC71028.1 TonB-dependent siderophore receptor [Roseateles sp. SL47]